MMKDGNRRNAFDVIARYSLRLLIDIELADTRPSRELLCHLLDT